MVGPNFENSKARLHLKPACQDTSSNNAVTMLMKSKKACLHSDASRHHHHDHESWRRGRAFIGCAYWDMLQEHNAKKCPDGKHIFLSKTFSRPNKAWKINPQNRSVTQVGSTQLLYTENLKISENCTQPIVETAMHLPNQLFGLDFLTFVVQPLTQSPPGPSLGLTNSWVIPGDGIGASLEATANWASVWPLARPFAVQQGVV